MNSYLVSVGIVLLAVSTFFLLLQLGLRSHIIVVPVALFLLAIILVLWGIASKEKQDEVNTEHSTKSSF